MRLIDAQAHAQSKLYCASTTPTKIAFKAKDGQSVKFIAEKDRAKRISL
jgi:hypothetical protein